VKVRDIMTARVVTAHTDTPVPVVAALLRDHRISAVPVVDDSGAVVGLVSEFDLLAREGEVAGDVMTTSVISVSEDTEVDDVRHLLVERRIRRVPVLAGRELVGIVSRSDVVAVMATEWVCQVCGATARGPHPPARCPACHAGQERFVMQDPYPGS
jgi:predicted transcriptional regulator